ncbi:hypothetical protein K439DRAFT_1359391 [Ramaria rubella]|nr:hypothetical protein K439DRAFT_1359391 [Ramaria rubella]
MQHPPSPPATSRLTPPPRPVPTPDTHVAPRRTSGPQYRSGHLESGRIAVLEDLGPIPILPITLLPDLLPQIGSDITVQLKKIKELHSLNGRWKLWPADPANTTGLEDYVFQALPLLFGSVVKSCETKPTAKLINNPAKTPDSTRSNTSRPDGYFLRQPAIFAQEKQLSHDSWEDIAIPLEYKKGSQTPDRSDNERKIIWSMHHILRNDPCRRFTYGITIENTEMRVWLCHRSATLVTASFNFITNQDTLVNLVTSLAFAEVASLGWDPTLRRKIERKNTLYEIDVNTGLDEQIQTFTAEEILSDFGAEVMQGRGTRVFRAKSMEREVVVKDMWREYDRAKEGDTLQEIKEKMQDDKDIDFEQDKKLFLSVMCHGDVQIYGVPDHTLHVIMRGTAIPSSCESFRVSLPGQISQGTARGGSEGSVGHTPLVLTKVPTHMGPKRTDASQAHHRVHYRIVFAELGQSVHEIRNLRTTFQVLEDATRALMLMHKYDFVHRDVSAGNILSVDGRGVLADLEYAKRLSDNTQHDVRTGTLYFMAAEVAAHRYLYVGVNLTTKLPPFKHNALHDIESLWWVATWSLFTHGVQDYTGDYDLEEHRKDCEELFSPYPAPMGRSYIIERPQLFKLQTMDLPVSFREAAASVAAALGELSQRYKRVEFGPKIDTSEILGIHDVFGQHLRRAKESSPLGDVIPLEIVKGIEPLAKRARID